MQENDRKLESLFVMYVVEHAVDEHKGCYYSHGTRSVKLGIGSRRVLDLVARHIDRKSKLTYNRAGDCDDKAQEILDSWFLRRCSCSDDPFVCWPLRP